MTYQLTKLLQQNTYPGRSIVLGKHKDGKHMVIAYFIMGRSVNSRNRIFVADGDGLRTQAHDPAKLSDPSLVIYAPVRVLNGVQIVTNGDQTDTIYDFMSQGKTFEEALRTRTFEPDPPIYTPRVSGIIENGNYKLSILKSADGNPSSVRRYFFEYTDPIAGQGHFIHTYRCDGNPVPSFEGEPEQVEIDGTLDGFTDTIWESLNEDNKVSLFTRFINLETGEFETRIVNKNQ
ncbi:MAG: inosine monophosphate cyclohydrolase [Oscillospiraceae bacterium]|jgi:IMP cyclohydrolase|nr:inosine monophosphate cyclohydrolase [Oscillospiraceae bacterium]